MSISKGHIFKYIMVCSNNGIDDAANKNDIDLCVLIKKSLSFRSENRYKIGYLLRMTKDKKNDSSKYIPLCCILF